MKKKICCKHGKILLKFPVYSNIAIDCRNLGQPRWKSSEKTQKICVKNQAEACDTKGV